MNVRIAVVMLSGLPIIANCASTPITSAGQVVRVTSDRAETEYCKPLGEVIVSGRRLTLESFENDLRNQAAGLGGNLIVRLYLEHEVMNYLPPQLSADVYKCNEVEITALRAELARTAAKEVVCNAGLDCEVKWSRGVQWLQDNARWKFRNVTDTLITTEGPLESANAAFEMTKVPRGDGRTYRIVLRAWCGASRCSPSVDELRASFVSFVLK